jgi:8-oxo-dGTP pyrophosphatase MutT (NUDIX family)
MVDDLAAIRAAIEAHDVKLLDVAEKRAAVATVLRAGEREPEVLLIRRADHVDDPWSGHMAFPGGRHEPFDHDILSTALRETREELGLDLVPSADLLGRLDDVEAIARAKRTGMVISQFVFALRGGAMLKPNYEVAEAIWVPIGPMVRRECATTRRYVHEGIPIDLPAFDVEGRIVWGLTYHMLERLFALLQRAPRGSIEPGHG